MGFTNSNFAAKKQTPAEKRRAKKTASRSLRMEYGDLARESRTFVRSAFEDEVDAKAMNISRGESEWHAMMREVWGSVYKLGHGPLPAGTEPVGWAAKILDTIATHDGWKSAASKCGGDKWTSTVTTATLERWIAPHFPPVPADTKAIEDSIAIAKSQKGKMWERLTKRLAHELGEARQAGKDVEAWIDSARGREVLNVACANAQEAALRVAGLRGSLGGIGDGNESDELRDVIDELKGQDQDRAREILLRAGRMTSAMNSRAHLAPEVDTGREEVVAVETGGDIARLLPVELALLGSSDPTLATLAFSRVVDANAQQHAMQGVDLAHLGPVIVLLDESGSMSGARDLLARSYLLTLLRRAVETRRPFAVVRFETSTTCHLFPSMPVDVGEMMRVVLKKPAGGGTAIGAALSEAARIIELGAMRDRLGREITWAEARKADVVLLTDGYSADDVAPPLTRLKATGARLHTIGFDMLPGNEIKAASATTTQVASNGPNGEDLLVGQLVMVKP